MSAVAQHRACPVCAAVAPAFAFSRNGFAMVRCQQCSLVYVGTDPSSIDFQALYGKSYYTGGHDTVFADYTGEQVARRAQARRKLFALRFFAPRVARVARSGRVVGPRGRAISSGCQSAATSTTSPSAVMKAHRTKAPGWLRNTARR